MFGWMTDTQTRRMPEFSGAYDGGFHAAHGLTAGTRVGTAMGWRAVDALAAGDMVLTFDHGLQPLVDVRREVLCLSDTNLTGNQMVFIPAGAMGNSIDVELTPDQGVLVETEAACDAYGDPFAIVKAKALCGFRGIARHAPRTNLEIITLVFAQAQVIYAEGGVLVHCPRTQVQLDDLGCSTLDYDVLSDREAAFIVECMAVEAQAQRPASSPMMVA